MVGRVAAAVLASGAASAIVVTGHQSALIEQAVRDIRVAGRRAAFVHASGYAEGLSASLKTGIAALPATAEAVLICLGDMPLVSAGLIDRLLHAYEQAPKPAIIVPVCHGARGNPVLWHRAFFADFAGLTGDRGARALLDRHAAHVIEVETADDAVLRDFDTPDSLPAD